MQQYTYLSYNKSWVNKAAFSCNTATHTWNTYVILRMHGKCEKIPVNSLQFDTTIEEFKRSEHFTNH